MTSAGGGGSGERAGGSGGGRSVPVGRTVAVVTARTVRGGRTDGRTVHAGRSRMTTARARPAVLAAALLTLQVRLQSSGGIRCRSGQRSVHRGSRQIRGERFFWGYSDTKIKGW